MRLRSNLARALALAAVALTAACASTKAPAPALYDPKTLPSGQLGATIELGHDIIADPHKYLPHNVVSDMSCSACHLADGTVKRGASFAGTYARFPQWNKRAKRVIMCKTAWRNAFSIA